MTVATLDDTTTEVRVLETARGSTRPSDRRLTTVPALTRLAPSLSAVMAAQLICAPELRSRLDSSTTGRTRVRL